MRPTLEHAAHVLDDIMQDERRIYDMADRLARMEEQQKARGKNQDDFQDEVLQRLDDLPSKFVGRDEFDAAAASNRHEFNTLKSAQRWLWLGFGLIVAFFLGLAIINVVLALNVTT